MKAVPCMAVIGRQNIMMRVFVDMKCLELLRSRGNTMIAFAFSLRFLYYYESEW